MSLLAQVRAEIKHWERDFASTHSRDPSVQDIRGQPAIAEKYKLYKKLSKATYTPPQTRTRLPAPKSRPVESVSPLPGFNPFSPAKKSAKRPSRVSPTSFHANPFATPAKTSRPKPGARTATCPDATLLPHPNTSSPPDHPVSTTAVSRARKRLRGEPVSPSPNKPKRQRVPSQAPPPFPTLEQDSSNSEHETDQELPQCDLTLSFVADSPVKAPAGGKSFNLLFDDVLLAFPIAKRPTDPLIARPVLTPDAYLSQRAPTDHSVLATLKPWHDHKSKGITPGPECRVNHVQGKFPTQVFPTKDYPSAPSHDPTSKSEASQPRTSMKRALDGSDLASLWAQYPLIPPSPPSHDSTNWDTGKGKARTTVSRKKLRVEDEDSDEGVDRLDGITVNVASAGLDRGEHQHADDLEWDPLPHLGARDHDPAATEQIGANHHASSTFTVDLPDKLRRVLAISPSRSQNGTEERVVRGLLYGDRVGHYDPSRGGAIWDVGETDEGALGDAETEDDWEGEPVPWEVGEL